MNHAEQSQYPGAQQLNNLELKFTVNEEESAMVPEAGGGRGAGGKGSLKDTTDLNSRICY